MSAQIRILSVNVAAARRVMIRGREVTTAIGKQPVTGPVAVTPLGLAGDEQADLSVHGGLSKAVYAYAAGQLEFWTRERHRALDARGQTGLIDGTVGPGGVGENLTIEGLDEASWWIGDVLELPGCVLVVSEPRFPCFKFNAAMGFDEAARLMVREGHCGAYLSVAQPGRVSAGETARLLPGPRALRLIDAFRARARA